MEEVLEEYTYLARDVNVNPKRNEGIQFSSPVVKALLKVYKKTIKGLITILNSKRSILNNKIIILLFVLSIILFSFAAKSQTVEKIIDLIDNHGAMIFLINQENGQIIYANDAAANFYDYPKEKMLDRKISYINTLSLEEITEKIELARTEQKNYFDFKHKLASGKIRNVEVYSYPLNLNGTSMIFLILNDVTPKGELEAYIRSSRIKKYFYTAFILILLVFIVLFFKKNKTLKLTKNKLENFNKVYQTFIDASDNLIYLKDKDLNYLFINKEVAESYNKDKNEIIGKNDYQISNKEIANNRRLTDNMVRSENKRIVKEFERDDRVYKLTKFPVDLLDESYGIGAFIEDITEKIKKENQIKYLLYRDSLTELYNRRFFEEEMKRLDTERQLPLSIIIADINGLKIINDSLGHKKGDELLKKSAKILEEATRKEDVLARQGGDEFAILLPKTEKEEAEKVIARIREKFRQTNADELTVNIALGAAVKTDPEENLEDVLRTADNNMYQKKLSESRSAKSRIINNVLHNLEAKSNETIRHIERMEKLAYNFGKKLGIAKSELNRLSLLAKLHDIGKITIAEKILKKPDKLTDKEWEIIKEHSEKGYQIASLSQEFAVIAKEICSHHEKWDGTGYPEGLKGEKIPYLARIINIIDSYDVMTHDRPYSKAISKTEALAEIKGCSGSQFDPDLAEAFVEMMDN